MVRCCRAKAMPRRFRSSRPRLRRLSAAVAATALLGACGTAAPTPDQSHEHALGVNTAPGTHVRCRASACTVATPQPFLASAEQARFHALPFVDTVYGDPQLASIGAMTLRLIDAGRDLTATFYCDFRGARPAHPPQVQATTVALVRRLCTLAVRPTSPG